MEKYSLLKNSPWGPVQSATRLCEGVYSVSTASHGGIWVSKEQQSKLPDCENFLGSRAWWEEDCDWCVPFCVFADEIEANMHDKEAFAATLKAAKDAAKTWHPLHVELYLGIPKQKDKNGWSDWVCRKCGHEVLTMGHRPEPIKWNDGHVCAFVRAQK